MPSPPLVAELHRVFPDLLVDLRLLLVAEVEEGEEEEGQTGGRRRSKRRKSSRRDNNHMDGHDDGRGVRTRLELEPM